MRVENEFTLGVPLSHAWPALLDLSRVAECLPGATLDPEAGPGVWRGTMKLPLGSTETLYRGIARLEDVDDDTNTASISVQAREAEGQGLVSALITNRLETVGDGTRFVANAQFSLAGGEADHGRAAVEDAIQNLAGGFAARFEQLASTEPPPHEPKAPDPVPRTLPGRTTPSLPLPAPATDALDAGNLLAGSPAVRAGAAGLAALLLLVIVALLGGKRSPKGLSVDVRFRR